MYCKFTYGYLLCRLFPDALQFSAISTTTIHLYKYWVIISIFVLAYSCLIYPVIVIVQDSKQIQLKCPARLSLPVSLVLTCLIPIKQDNSNTAIHQTIRCKLIHIPKIIPKHPVHNNLTWDHHAESTYFFLFQCVSVHNLTFALILYWLLIILTLTELTTRKINNYAVK